MAIFCQACGAPNSPDDEICARCQQKLLVVSGALAVEEISFEEDDDESVSFDEHLLERISVLEEAVRRTAETLQRALAALNKQERNILINHTGLTALRDVLDRRGVLGADEWRELWKSELDGQLLALEKRQGFAAIKERVVALYRGGKRREFAQILEDAEFALYALDVPRALQLLESAFRMDKRNYELACFIGETHFNEGAASTALAYFGHVLESKPDHYEGLVYSGVLLHEQGKDDYSRALLERAVELYPDSFLALFSLGAVHAGEGRLRRAVVYLEQAVKIEPVAQAHFLLGSAYYEMGKPTRAIASLKDAVRHDPAFEEAHHLLGLAYLDRGWKRRALDSFRRAQQLNPKKLRYGDLVRFLSGQASSPLPRVDGEAADLLGEAERLLAGDVPRRALSLYRSAIESEPRNATLLLSYALACLRLDESEEARSAMQRLLDLEQDEMLRATAYATMIEALRNEGRYREGNGFGRRLLEEGASEFAKSIAYYEMAYNLAEMEEDLDQALDYARMSLEHSPDELRQFPLAALGWVHYKRSEFSRAVDCLARSSELASSATTLTHLGMALLATGEEEDARKVLDEARRLSSGSDTVEQKLMECLKDSTRLHEMVRRGQGR
jgi:tetratricopeptide (TPR) repeat protein